MNQSVSVSLSQAGKHIKTLNSGVEREAGLGDLLEKVRLVQQQTNQYLTELISEAGADDRSDDIDEDDVDSDEEVEEPETKIAKTQ